LGFLLKWSKTLKASEKKMATDKLLEEFPPVSTEAWEEAIRKDLKGADYQKKLVWQTDEGLAVKPYYRKEDIAGLDSTDRSYPSASITPARRLNGDWCIREEIDAINPEEANQAAQRAVAAGAEQIAFLNANIQNGSDLGLLLVNLKENPIHFQNAGKVLLRLLTTREKGRSASAQLSSGWNPFESPEFAAEILRTAPTGFVPFTIDGSGFEESGATVVQEMGFTLAAAIDFLADMASRNIDVDRAAAAIEFSFAIGSNYFFQIAKFRAFRNLWATVQESFGGKQNIPARIHARTSHWNKTIYDPHVNILRATTEAMSGALGGADSISVAAFDECYRAPNEASRRMARNTQIVLKQEALLSRVADPGAGSYYLEFLTDFIARESWKMMQGVEGAGGFMKANASGQLAKALNESMAAREKAVVERRCVFTGTNQYADPAEKALDRIDPMHRSIERRGARSYEQLRLRTERHAVLNGKTPRILLAEAGDVKMRSARSSFAQNFLASAGFELVTQRFESAGEIAPGNADLIVLCSSDAEYAGLAAELFPMLKTLGCSVPVIVAGNPASADQLRELGVADFIHVRSNPVEFLTAWQQRLGIEA
jgi:methylmalonyl-CoA mutase